MSAVDGIDRELLAALEAGLPFVPSPYEAVGRGLGLTEDEVIVRLKRLVAGGVIRRFGAVVRHRALGYVANAMVVWDFADENVPFAAKTMTAFPFVTLCYRRPRRDGWPYNLFCMIHGRERPVVLAQVEQVRAALGALVRDHAVLFSTRAFKQRGASYRSAQALEPTDG
ncbi:MAG: AsnC family transcriptional regulator [Rhodospirillales bacterium]|nr:AsnC family transcriptional regulator [Rhodospirillales bacterium]